METTEQNTICNCDCVEGLKSLPAGSVQLVFADPPFNIGYDYDVYRDKLKSEVYMDWSRQWIEAVYQALANNGTFWLAIGDEYAAELKLLSQEIGFCTRSWVVWYYTFGVNCKFKFTRSHAHLFYFVKDPNEFVFHDADPQNRIPSARQLVYNDKRANPVGRLPDDTWMIRPANAVGQLHLPESGSVRDSLRGDSLPDSVCDAPRDLERTWRLRPQDIAECFQPTEDTWYFPRVAGTFKERAGFHGCQMPEQLLGRIIRGCSSPGDLVLDPFSGSATTLAVAKKLGRRFLGFELSEDYVTQGRARLSRIRVGDPLDGSAEPTISAPATANGKALNDNRPSSAQRRSTKKLPSQAVLPFVDEQAAENESRAEMLTQTMQGVLRAFLRHGDGRELESLLADPARNAGFVDDCRQQGLAGDARSWNSLLFRLRQAGDLEPLPRDATPPVPTERRDCCLSGAEFAWRTLVDREADSLDEILCDPQLAAEFDRLASEFSPGGEPVEYRWAAIQIRQLVKTARIRSSVIAVPRKWSAEFANLASVAPADLPAHSGLFQLQQGTETLYVGDSCDLRARLTSILAGDCARRASTYSDEPIRLRYRELPIDPADGMVYAAALAQALKPRWNLVDLWEGLAIESGPGP